LACARKPRSEFLGTAIVVYSGEVERVRLNANAEHVAWFAENFRVTYKMHGPSCRTDTCRDLCCQLSLPTWAHGGTIA
jgi:hypothetical protein